MKKKILHHTSIMIIFAVLVTFLAASVVTYNKLNTYMQRGVREEAQYICLAMDEYGDSFLTKKLQTVSSSRVTLIRKDGTVLYDSETSPKKLANHSDRPEFIQAEKNGKSESIRYSETFAKKTFYYAVKLDDGNVLRVGKTVDSIYSTWTSSLAGTSDAPGTDPGVCFCTETDQRADPSGQRAGSGASAEQCVL